MAESSPGCLVGGQKSSEGVKGTARDGNICDSYSAGQEIFLPFKSRTIPVLQDICNPSFIPIFQ